MDTIANMLSGIKNAGRAGRFFIEIPYSSMKEEILKVLKEKGFIESFKIFKLEGKSFKMLHIDLKYDNGVSLISEAKRVSKSGRRVYENKVGMKRVVGGYGISIVSTSKGVMDSMEAKRKKLGGEVICEVY